MKLILFADDTNIFYSNDNYNELINTVNDELSKIKEWMDRHKLSLNISKTKAMIFGNDKINSVLQISIDGAQIGIVPEN